MPRRGSKGRRVVPPDPVHGSQLLTKLINQIMWDGQRSVSEDIVYGALQMVSKKTGKSASEVFDQAIKNVMPVLEVKARRVGGANYQVPIEVRSDRRQTLAIRWLTNYARQRSGRTMKEKLAAELLDAANNTGGAVKRREDTHKMAEANKAFAHYRW